MCQHDHQLTTNKELISGLAESKSTKTATQCNFPSKNSETTYTKVWQAQALYIHNLCAIIIYTKCATLLLNTAAKEFLA